MNTMRVSVWDTYVHRMDGNTMHFDILVPSTLQDTITIFSYGREYLETKPFGTGQLSTEECRFCHIQAVPDEVALKIQEKGYYIIEMENCT